MPGIELRRRARTEPASRSSAVRTVRYTELNTLSAIAGARRNRALLGVADRDERGARRRELVGDEAGHVGIVEVRRREPRLQSGRQRDDAVDARRYLLLRRRVWVLQIEAAGPDASHAAVATATAHCI